MFYFLNSNIKYLRKLKGYTQPQLAEMLDINYKTIANIESGSNNATIYLLDKIHEIFSISTDDLIYKDLSKN